MDDSEDIVKVIEIYNCFLARWHIFESYLSESRIIM